MPLLAADDLRTRADVVVVGSGAGGSMAALELARAGHDVLVVEMGEAHPPERFTQREEEMIPRLFQDSGARTTVDMSVQVVQGKGLGGSTVHNLNLCKRVPDALLDRWADQQLLPDLPARLGEACDAVEAMLEVTEVTEGQINRHNALFRQGCRALGLHQGRLRHNRKGCVGSGFCELGCAYDAKQNAARIVLPAAAALGARMWTRARVDRIDHRFGRVTGVRGVRHDSQGRPHRFRVEARAVVLAASATASTALVLASGLQDRWRQAGAGLHLHPAATVAAVFPEPVEAWRGIPQSIESTELLDPVVPNRRVWLVPVFGHPATAAGMIPGTGAPLMEWLSQYRYLAASSPMLHDHGSGRVGATRDGRPLLHYRLDPSDGRALAQGMAMAARIWLAAGARRVLVPMARPLVVDSLAEADALASIVPRRADPPLAAVHPMGGLRMGGDPRLGACDGFGRYHAARGLWVADGSLMPSSTGGPPQVTIYALGRMVGQSVASQL